MGGCVVYPVLNALGAEPRLASILVVEDNFFLRYSLARWLRRPNYNVLEAASADEAIVLLSSTLIINLVITDAEMPGKSNGCDLAERIKHEHSALPVIMVSGTAPPKEIGEMGVSQFFRKPYDLDALAAVVGEVVAHGCKTA
jgi:two-component system, response regulator PdtaR